MVFDPRLKTKTEKFPHGDILVIDGLERSRIEGSGDALSVGGDVESVLAALEIDPEALGAEVRAVADTEGGERVPIKDSKGEVRHEVSREEAEHYERIGLRPQEVDGRDVLVRDDIDWEQRDRDGRTNRERADQGLAPLDPEGRPYELHHVGQDADGMLAELTRDEHRGPGADRILHDPSKTSTIDRQEFDKIRQEHWKARAGEVSA